MFIIRLLYNWSLILIFVPIFGGLMLSISFVIEAITSADIHGIDSKYVANETKSLFKGSEWLRLG